MKNTLYTIQRINGLDIQYGPVHGSMDAETTMCSQQIDHNWFITK